MDQSVVSLRYEHSEVVVAIAFATRLRNDHLASSSAAT